MVGNIVTADPQFSVSRILKPWTGFEAVYDSTQFSIPLAEPNSQGKYTRYDDQAGTPGYYHRLLRATKVPFGSRVVFWLPIFLNAHELQTVYRWTFVWRLRNLYDHRTQRVPYHLARQAIGASPAGESHVAIPACIQSFQFTQAEPAEATPAAPAVADNWAETVINYGDGSQNDVINPVTDIGGEDASQQGVLLTGVGTSVFQPSYRVLELQALGDEVLLYVAPHRTSGDVTNDWMFDHGDDLLAQFFSYPVGGVHMFYGSAP